MSRKSWVETANAADCDFPLQNLPYGVVASRGGATHCAVAIGDQALNIAELEAAGLLDAGAKVFGSNTLNAFMAQGSRAWTRVRERLTELLAEDGDRALRDDEALRTRVSAPLKDVEPQLPFQVSGFTDFYSGRHHATNAGIMLRGPDNALPPNWLHVPIAYNGRASTVVPSGTPVRRPLGQRLPPGADAPVFGPSRRLDFELEFGAVVGLSTTMGEPLTVAEADDHIFGYVLLNDWSARDIQAWEYQPLGPFQAKVFATSISPWVVTKAALEPFRVSTPPREKVLLPYLREPRPLAYDIALDVLLRPSGGEDATIIAHANTRHLYYSAPQQLTHHAIGGCRMKTGDLLGSGTISGPNKGEYGSMLELSWGGKEPLNLPGGVTRTFLEDGDEVIFRGYALGKDHRIGFGECAGRILPAPAEREW